MQCKIIIQHILWIIIMNLNVYKIDYLYCKINTNFSHSFSYFNNNPYLLINLLWIAINSNRKFVFDVPNFFT